jgi:hypothetical protein
MRADIEKRLQALEGRLSPEADWDNIFIRREHEPMPKHDPDNDLVVTLCRKDYERTRPNQKALNNDQK